MPRFRIIVLDKPASNAGNVYRYAMWADVPSARQPFYANATAVSAWKDALPSDTNNIQGGVVTEKVDTVMVPTTWTLLQVEAELQARWTSFQNDVNTSNPWVRYGSTWDGVTWTLSSIA